MQQTANEQQEGGTHYQAVFQHWDYVMECLAGRYLEGNITKYVARWRKKNGVQDLRKALHYLQKLKEEYRDGRVNPLGYLTTVTVRVHTFAMDNGLKIPETFVCEVLARWQSMFDLDAVQSTLLALIKPLEDATTGDATAAYVNQDRGDTA